MAHRFSARGLSLHPRGWSLIDTLLGLSLGLVVLGLAGQVFLQSREAWQQLQVQLALLHQIQAVAARFSHDLPLTQGFDWEAWSQSPRALTDVTPHVAAGRGKSGDWLELSYPSAARARDCQDNLSVARLVRNRYQRNDKKELTCRDTFSVASTAQALAEGVEDFRVWLLVREGADAWRWWAAGELPAKQRVVAIRICLRLASVQAVPTPSTALRGCLGETVRADRLWRRLWWQTWFLPAGGLS